jgi:tetratricopeptide (TPR) repeat protein
MELTLSQAIKKGIEAQRAGKVQEADRYYTAILKVQPKHPEANHNLGVLALEIGKTTDSLSFFQTALEVNQKKYSSGSVI